MICGLMLVLTVISGVLLSNAGKPYSTGIFTIHKLIAVGTIILIGMSIYKQYKAVGFHTLYLVAFAFTGVFFLTLLVSGALLSLVDGEILSLDELVLNAVLRTHQIVPLLVLAASMLSLYLLIRIES